MSKDIVKINSHAFDNEIKKQGLKIWWLAEQLGVDRRTVSRWVNGKVKWIRTENLMAAAAMLGCSPDALVARSELALYATREDQSTAAHIVHSEKLLAVLTPSGKFELAEALIRSLLSPDLPILTLANLHIELTQCCWQQNKLTEAEHYAMFVLDVGERADDPLLALRAQQHLVTIYSKGGQLTKAHELINLCLANPAIDIDPEIHARILFDSSNTLGHAGASMDLISESRRHAREVLEKAGIFSKMHETLNELGLALFNLDWGLLEQAHRASQNAYACASRIDFKQGLGFAKLIEAELLSRQGQHGEAQKTFHEFYSDLQHGDRGLYESMGAAILRRAGKHGEALELARIGQGTSNEVFQSHCSLEIAYIYDEMGFTALAQQYYRQAKAGYEKAGAFGRARKMKDQHLPSPSIRSIKTASFGPVVRSQLQIRA